MNKKEKTLSFSKDQCIFCGKCVTTCPTSAWTGQAGYNVSLGGLYGKQITIGRHFLPLLHSEDELYRVIDVVLDFFESHAKPGERFARTVERIGWDKVEQLVREVL